MIEATSSEIKPTPAIKEGEPRYKILFLQFSPEARPHISMAKIMFGGKPGEQEPEVKDFSHMVVAEIRVLDKRGERELAEREKKAELLLPSSVEKYAGIIITGSPFVAYPRGIEGNKLLIAWWKKRAFEFVQAAVEHRIPILGICFGAELVAEALGGKVVEMRSREGKKIGERGWSVIRRSGGFDDPVMRGLPEEFVAAQNHSDIVALLPPGGVLLAENEYGVQGFRVDNKKGNPLAWGFQFHPERSPNIVNQALDEKWLSKMKARGLNPEEIRARGEQDSLTLQRIFRNFLNQIRSWR